MFDRKLIRRIKIYLREEYREKEASFISRFLNSMKMQDDEEDYFDEEDDYQESVHRASKKTSSANAQRKSHQPPGHIDKLLVFPSSLNTKKDMERYLFDSLEEITFAQKLNQYMYEKQLTTAKIYKRCLVDRKLISKITTQERYHPSKHTVFALCIGLRLSLSEGEEFLSLAGYSFNRSSKYDLIIKFMLESGIYDLDIINEMLLYFKQPCFE